MNPPLDSNSIQQTIRERFLRCYANLPLNSREEIIAVLENDGPVSWKAAYFDVVNDTPRGHSILSKIEKLNIL